MRKSEGAGEVASWSESEQFAACKINLGYGIVSAVCDEQFSVLNGDRVGHSPGKFHPHWCGADGSHDALGLKINVGNRIAHSVGYKCVAVGDCDAVGMESDGDRGRVSVAEVNQADGAG